MKQVFVFLALILLSLNLNAGGPWLYRKNGGFFQFQTTSLAFPYSYLAVGNPYQDQLNISRQVITYDFGAYMEYGLSDRFNLIGKIPFQYAATGERTEYQYNSEILEEGSIFGLSNVELGAKMRVLDKKLKAAISINTIWNTVNKDLSKGLITGYDYNAIGAIAHIGGGLSERAYAFMDLGATFTSNNFSDYFQNYIEAGYRFGRAFYVKVSVDIKKSFENGSHYNENLIQTGLHPNDQDWVGFGFGASYETKKGIGFNFSTGGALKATYMGIGAPVTVGIYKKV